MALFAPGQLGVGDARLVRDVLEPDGFVAEPALGEVVHAVAALAGVQHVGDQHGVVVAGDLTSEGYAPQFRQAKRFLDRLSDLERVVIPGNHDLMNVGFLHFRDAFGKSEKVIRLPFDNEDGSNPDRWATVVSVNSSKPDLAEGELTPTLKVKRAVVAEQAEE